MATKLLRKEPSLPAVKLYLDDIKDVTEIIARAYADSGKPQDVQFVFKVNDDFECTTLAELEEHGGVAKKFEMRVESGSPILSTRYGIDFHPPFDLSKSVKAEVSSQLHRIILDRRIPLKTWFREISDSKYILYSMMALFIVVNIADHFVTRPLVKSLLSASEVFCFLFWLTGLYFAFNRKDAVNLYFKRASDQRKIEKRKELLEKIILLALGVFFGVLGTLVTQHFKR